MSHLALPPAVAVRGADIRNVGCGELLCDVELATSFDEPRLSRRDSTCGSPPAPDRRIVRCPSGCPQVTLCPLDGFLGRPEGLEVRLRPLLGFDQ